MDRKTQYKNICAELLCFQFTKTDNIGQIRNSLREMIYYTIFLITITVAILFSTSQFWVNMEVINMTGGETFRGDNFILKNIFQISNFGELWIAITHMLTGNIYWIYWSKTMKQEYREEVELSLIGAARIRQIRVQKVECQDKDVQFLHNYCYPEYSNAVLETSPFGLQNSTAWKYTSAEDIENAFPFVGLLYTYPAGGYYTDFLPNISATREKINNLKNNLWIDRQTRAIFIDFSVYNGNLNFFSSVKILFEIPPTGGIVTNLQVKSLKLIPYVNVADYFILACELISMCFLAYYFIISTISVLKNCRTYFQNFWNVLEFIILTLFIVILLIRMYLHIKSEPLLNQIANSPNSFVDFDEVTAVDQYLTAAYAIFLFCLWLKLFKYISLSRTFGQLNATIVKCAHDLSAFLLIFFTIFFAYALLGYQLFGSKVSHFSTIPNSIFTLLKSVNGEFHYPAMEKAEKIIAPIYFVSFIFLVFFVLLNMFIAIICDSYTMVKAEITDAANEAEISQFMKRGAQRIFNKVEPIKALFEYTAATETQKNLKKVLKLAKYNDKEIGLLFAEYDFGEDDIADVEVDDFVNDVESNDYQMYEAAQFIRSIKQVGTILTAKQLQRQFNEMKMLEQNVLKLTQLVDELVAKHTSMRQKQMNK